MNLNIEQIIEAVEADDNIGFCRKCGAEHCCIEPDARKYKCEECGELAVYGAEELLIMMEA